MYDYRKLSVAEQQEIVSYRRANCRPWHSPPHALFTGGTQYLLTAACFEHAHFIGHTHERMTEFENTLLGVCETFADHIYAWCLLPNHYHVLLKTQQIKPLLSEIGRMHGRTSFNWNKAEEKRGRKVWFNCFDRAMRSHGHFWASMNYVHHNPVKHGYVANWQDWPWSSAADFIEQVGRDKAQTLWQEFPILDYGKGWDFD